MWMLIWPGLWPGVGIRVISSASLWSLATRSALPASAIGFTESANTAILSGSTLWSRQYSYSVLPKTYRAFENVGTHLPPTRVVFQPTWSTCRCVHSTVSMLSGGKPALVRVSRNGSLRLFQVGTLRPCLSLPRPVWTTIRRCGVSTTSEWIDIFRRPSSLAKCGISQGSFWISSLVASGRMKRVLPTVSSSTILVILTLLTFQCLRRSSLVGSSYLSPQAAGESHMDLGPLLHCLARWILRTTPTTRRESHGEVQEGFSAVVGSTCGERTARSAGGIGYRLGRGPVRSRDLLGDGGVWTGQGRPAAAVSAPGARDSQSRHLQPCVPLAQAGSVRSCVPALHGGVCQGQPAQSHRGGGGRRQGAAGRLRAWFALRASAPGQRLCGGGANVSCPAKGSWPQRDQGGVGGIGAAVPRRLHRHGRCAALPSCDGQDGTRGRWRLCAGDQGQPGTSVQGRGRAVCSIRRAQGRQEGRTVDPRPARSAPGNHHAQYQPGCRPRLPRRGCDRPRHLAQAIAGPSRRAAGRALLPALQV